MKTLSSLGIGLSVVFCCLLLAFVAELYYLLWWKKRIAGGDIEDGYSSSARELFHLLCSKNKSWVLGSKEVDSHALAGAPAQDPDGIFVKSFGEDGGEEDMVGLHSLSGLPRFLFTIKEETREEMESDDGRSKGAGDEKSRRGSEHERRNLNELLLVAGETPYLTPLSSPPFMTPPSTPFDCYPLHGFNPLFESSEDSEINPKEASPPPKFKFLRDAEEKLCRRAMVERGMRNQKNGCGAGADDCASASSSSSSSKFSDEEDGSFIRLIKSKMEEEKGRKDLQHLQQNHLHSSSQVLPLPFTSSPKKPGNIPF